MEIMTPRAAIEHPKPWDELGECKHNSVNGRDVTVGERGLNLLEIQSVGCLWRGISAEATLYKSIKEARAGQHQEAAYSGVAQGMGTRTKKNHTFLR